ncbi:MAG: hypothetical protein PHD01_11960 [Geobacteraceae bacterium]|nr:hypothetical protein [Geobacteraceae bacterium]
MKSHFKIFALVAAAICVFIVGAGFGYMKATDRYDKYITNTLYDTSATEIKGRVGLLELLKNGNYDKAQKRLEALVDVDLGTLTLYVDNPPQIHNNDVIEAIIIAKRYRKKNPEHRISSTLENSVKKTLDFVKDK